MIESVTIYQCITNGFIQVRLFDSQHYLKAFRAGDVWVAVGWSSDVLPVAKTMSNVSVMVPKSGASLWADFWVHLEIWSHHFKISSSHRRYSKAAILGSNCDYPLT